jgi:hypothetical protein
MAREDARTHLTRQWLTKASRGVMHFVLSRLPEEVHP